MDPSGLNEMGPPEPMLCLNRAGVTQVLYQCQSTLKGTVVAYLNAFWVAAGKVFPFLYSVVLMDGCEEGVLQRRKNNNTLLRSRLVFDFRTNNLIFSRYIPFISNVFP